MAPTRRTNTNQAFVIYAPTPGDANLDGRVDVNDLTIVLSHFGQTGTDVDPGRVHRRRQGGRQRPDRSCSPTSAQTARASAGARPPYRSRAPWPCSPPACWPPQGGSRSRKLLVGLRKPINRDSAVCGPTGRVAATEAPPEFRFARPTLPGLYRSVRGVLGGILLSVDALWVDPRGGKRDWGWGILRTEDFWD